MALYYDLPVYRDVYRLILKIFEFTKDFPREYKYSLGQDLKHDSIVLVRSIYRANKAKSNKRKQLIRLNHKVCWKVSMNRLEKAWNNRF
jgi:23S rRNA-intervening sequence protein